MLEGYKKCERSYCDKTIGGRIPSTSQMASLVAPRQSDWLAGQIFARESLSSAAFNSHESPVTVSQYGYKRNN